MDDQLILEKIRNGDKKQLSAIYDNYRMEFIGWITHNYRCSEEEAQEIFQVAIITFCQLPQSWQILNFGDEDRDFDDVGKTDAFNGQDIIELF